MKCVIKPADSSDYERCAEIAVKAWQAGYDEYRDILGQELFVNVFPEWEKAKGDSMKPYFSGREGLYAFKAVEGDMITGFITCRLDQEKMVGELCNNAVDPDFQGRGVGGEMYRWILDFFRKEKMTAALVNTMDENAYLPARKAYEKAGFQKKLKRLTYYMKL